MSLLGRQGELPVFWAVELRIAKSDRPTRGQSLFEERRDHAGVPLMGQRLIENEQCCIESRTRATCYLPITKGIGLSATSGTFLAGLCGRRTSNAKLPDESFSVRLINLSRCLPEAL